MSLQHQGGGEQGATLSVIQSGENNIQQKGAAGPGNSSGNPAGNSKARSGGSQCPPQRPHHQHQRSKRATAAMINSRAIQRGIVATEGGDGEGSQIALASDFKQVPKTENSEELSDAENSNQQRDHTMRIRQNQMVIAEPMPGLHSLSMQQYHNQDGGYITTAVVNSAGRNTAFLVHDMEMSRTGIDQSNVSKNQTYPAAQQTHLNTARGVGQHLEQQQVSANKSVRSQYQSSEHDIEYRHIEVPRLIHCNAQSSMNKNDPAPYNNNDDSYRGQIDQQNNQEILKSYVSGGGDRSVKIKGRQLNGAMTVGIKKSQNSKSYLISNESSYNAFDERWPKGSPSPIREISQKIHKIRAEGRIDFTKNLREIEIDESSIYHVYTNDDPSDVRLNETPSLSKQTSQLGVLIAPAELQITNMKDMTSATTNSSLKKQSQHQNNNQLSSSKRLHIININGLKSAAAHQLTGKKIFMVQNYGVGSSDEYHIDEPPMDFHAPEHQEVSRNGAVNLTQKVFELPMTPDDKTNGGDDENVGALGMAQVTVENNNNYNNPHKPIKNSGSSMNMTKDHPSQTLTKKRSKNQRRKLIVTGTGAAVGVQVSAGGNSGGHGGDPSHKNSSSQNTNSSTQRQQQQSQHPKSRKVSQNYAAVEEERQGGGNEEKVGEQVQQSVDGSQQHPIFNQKTIIIDQSKLSKDPHVSPVGGVSGAPRIVGATDIQRLKQQDGLVPFWQNGAPLPIFSLGVDQVDPMLLRNSIMNGSAPNNNLLQDIASMDESSVVPFVNKKSRRMAVQSGINAQNSSKANILSPNRTQNNFDTGGSGSNFDKLPTRNFDKKNRTATDKSSAMNAATTMDGFFLVDGHLAHIDHGGKISFPPATDQHQLQKMLGNKEVPSYSVFNDVNSNGGGGGKRGAAADHPHHHHHGNTKMNQINNKLKLMRGFNKSQVRRNAREVPSVKHISHNFSPGQYDRGFGVNENNKQRNTAAPVGKITVNNAKQASKSATKPISSVSYGAAFTATTPYMQPQGEFILIGAPNTLVNPQNPKIIATNNTVLEDIIENSKPPVFQMSPKEGQLKQQVKIKVRGQSSNSESKKPMVPITAVVPPAVAEKTMAKTPVKVNSNTNGGAKFPDYSSAYSPLKVNEQFAARQNNRQFGGGPPPQIHSEKKQTTTKLQSLEAMKVQQMQHQQQIARSQKQSGETNLSNIQQQTQQAPKPQNNYNPQRTTHKSSSTHIKRSFTSLPQIMSKEYGPMKGKEQAATSVAPIQVGVPNVASNNNSATNNSAVNGTTGNIVIQNQASAQKQHSQSQQKTRDQSNTEKRNANQSPNFHERMMKQMQNNCGSETMLNSINNELAQIEKFQNEMYERTKCGDLVIYDNEAKIMTFWSKQSKKASEVILYQDLDFQELKKQLESLSNIPVVGCNEVKMKDEKTGKVLYQQPENAYIYEMQNPQKCRYSIMQSQKDQDRVNNIRKQFGKLKNVKEFPKKLYIPNVQKQYCLFYGRFESGNLNRVVQRNLGTQQQEYDLYLQPDTNSEGLMHWYYFKMMTKGLEPGTRIKLNIRNLHRSRSLYEQGMLPKICYEDTLQMPEVCSGSGGDNYYQNPMQKEASDDGAAATSVSVISGGGSESSNGAVSSRKIGWHVDAKVTHSINFFKTDQRSDDYDQKNFHRDKNFFTLSFIYEVQEMNEAVFLAYDKPYTYSQDLKKLVDEVRNDDSLIDICQVSSLCKSMGGNDVRLITITENVRHSINFYESVKFHLKKDVRDRFSIKTDIEKLTEAQKQTKFLNYFRKPQKKQQQQQPVVVVPPPVDVDGAQKEDGTKPDENGENNEGQPKPEKTETPPTEPTFEQLTAPENAELDIGIESKYQKHLIAHHGKRAMIITSRVHPGEIQASYALEGILRFLLTDHQKAKDLRQKYIIYIVPMLNPDGVIHGNHRTDLAGFDNNRRWAEPSPWIHPVMYACKFLARMIKEERQIDVYCDIHGHFQAYGGFAYCCSYNKQGNGTAKADLDNDAYLRVIPQLLGQRNAFFSADHCTFTMENYKNGSSRQVMFNEYKIQNSFTLENSFFARFSDDDLQALQEHYDKQYQKMKARRLKRSQSECSTNSSGGVQALLPKQQQESRNNSTVRPKEGEQNNSVIVDESKIQTDKEYADKPSTEQKQQPNTGEVTRKQSGKEKSLNRVESRSQQFFEDEVNKNEQGRSLSVQKQQEGELCLAASSDVPPDQQPQVFTSPQNQLPRTHHFTSFDHEKLGIDMCHIFHKVFIKYPRSQNEGPSPSKTQEEIKAIMEKVRQKLTFKQVAPLTSAQSISQAYGGGHPKFARR